MQPEPLHDVLPVGLIEVGTVILCIGILELVSVGGDETIEWVSDEEELEGWVDGLIHLWRVDSGDQIKPVESSHLVSRLCLGRVCVCVKT